MRMVQMFPGKYLINFQIESYFILQVTQLMMKSFRVMQEGVLECLSG